MAKNKGWARVDRAVRDSWVWQDKPFAKGQAWIDLILRANHETRPVLIRGQLVTVEAGSMITSLRKLADEWGWDVKTVRHYLADLERDGMVHTMRTTNWTTITLVNWGKFQNQGNTERTSERHTEGYTERTQTKNKTINNKYTNPRARYAWPIRSESRSPQRLHGHDRRSGAGERRAEQAGQAAGWQLGRRWRGGLLSAQRRY